jgi:tetraacyldisaccharide 4'-kinase
VEALESRLLATWYGDRPPPLVLRLLEPVYRAVVAVRRSAFRRGWFRTGHPGRPVVVVGNLTVGGTGKTPLVVWLAVQLRDRGFRPAVVSRGYGGRGAQEPRRVGRGDDPAEVGDEPVLIAALADVPVWICRDRLAAARAAVAAGADVILSDDGLQHYALRRDFEIVLVDGTRGFGNGHCLPAGPLREDVGRLGEVDAVVCNGGPCCPPEALAMALEGADAVRLSDGLSRPLEAFAGTPVHAVAAIGNPERFFSLLEGRGLTLIRHPLPDHAVVPGDLLEPGDGPPVMMTSKDAVKCRQRPSRAWEVPVCARLEGDGLEILSKILALPGFDRRR